MTLQKRGKSGHLRQRDTTVDNAEYEDEPTKEEILESIRIGMEQALAGETRPAREALAEIRCKIASDDHSS